MLGITCSSAMPLPPTHSTCRLPLAVTPYTHAEAEAVLLPPSCGLLLVGVLLLLVVGVLLLLQVDGHPVKGWDEKALLAHVMGEEGKQQAASSSSKQQF